MNDLNMLFLGTSAVKPGKNNDTACALINNRYMVDTGWYSAVNMLQFGVSPLELDYLFITHSHPDHYLGLAQYLFYLAMSMKQYSERAPMKIVGPQQSIEKIVNLAYNYLDHEGTEKFSKSLKVKIIPLTDGDIIETEDVMIKAFATQHPVPSLGYIFQDNGSKKKIVYSGDTGPCENLVINAHGADLLVHEASCGDSFSMHEDHSGAPDAALVAKQAKVKQLALVHYIDEQQQEILASAKNLFANTITPSVGTRIEI
ncbi:MAG: MBL fold metallo-hydrolase [Victivallaceae bacterium]|nr:MBL fold metallo-hydrolase [Victivallaceae bacterium]